MTSFSLLTPPAVEPVSLAEAKTHLRVDIDDDNALIESLISGARLWAERYTGRAFITQTWTLALDLAPGQKWWDGEREGPVTGLNGLRALSLPRAPLQSVTKIESFNDNDTATVWPSSNYFVDTAREPGRLVLRIGAAWPSPERTANGLVVTYTTGYGDDAASVPEPIRAAIRELVAQWYEHRGDDDAYPFRQTSFIAQALLAPYRIRHAGIAV
ncbi:MAG: head-tail connector protein [Alphaproteobacteria bacterium]|nr:head-tail connector protein [Alphaproteobacteria bacterium]